MELVAEKYKKTEIGIIPKDWELRTLGEVGEVKMCRRIFNNETSSSGSVPFFKIGTFGKEPDAYISRDQYENYRKRFSFPRKGDILISAAGTIGRTIVYNGEDAYFQDSNIVWIENDFSLVSNEFLYHLYQVVKYNTEGGTIQRLYNSILKAAKFACPSKCEQTAIANSLSDMDTLISETEKLIEKKKAIKQGVMQELLRPKEGWENVAIRDIAKVGRGRVISNKEISKSIEELYPVYSSQTTNNGIMGFIDSFDFEGEYITWTTDGEKAGTVFYRNGKFNCTNVCGTIKLKNYNAKFIAYVLAIESPKHVSRNLANPKLMNEPMKNVRITIPVNINEQEDIANTISNFENEIEALEVKYNKLKLQKQGMMQALLTGKIRLI